ncbi:MAG: iron hydrogenase, partial [Ruthenibacterium sp.]
MRGIYSSVTDIRRKVFTEVARLSYENKDLTELTKIPYTIIPGEMGSYRGSVFLERAIVSERLRLCMGLPLRPVDEQCPISEGVEKSA